MLLTNLPLHWTEENIISLISPYLDPNERENSINHIIFLQDCNDYVRIKRELKDIKKKLKITKNNDELVKRQSSLLLEFNSIENETKKMKKYYGSCIIIFNCVKYRINIENAYNSKRINTGIKFSRLRDPLNINYENLNFPDSDRRHRFIILTLSNLLFISIAFYFILNYSLSSQCASGVQFSLSNFCNNMISLGAIDEFLAPVALNTSSYFISKFYSNMNQKRKFKSSLESKYSSLAYSNMMIYFNFVFILLPMWIYQGKIVVATQVAYTFALYFGRRIFMKFVGILVTRITRQRGIKDKEALKMCKEKKIKKLIEEDEYDFIEGIAVLTPIIFMMLGFFFINPLVILPVGIVTIYLLGLFDKFQILKLSKPMKSNSIENGIVLLSCFNWDLTVYLTCLLFWLIAFYETKAQTTFADIGKAMTIGFIGLFGILCLGSLLQITRDFNSRIKSRLDEIHKDLSYSSANPQFSSTYREEFPLKSNTKIIKLVDLEY